MKHKYVYLLIAGILLVCIIGVLLVILNREPSSTNIVTISQPVSIPTESNTIYTYKDEYNFEFNPENWAISKERANVVILSPQSHKSAPVLVFALEDSNGSTAQNWISDSTYSNVVPFIVENYDTFAVEYIRESYSERRYIIRKEDKLVEINYRLTDKSTSGEFDYREYEGQVNEIISSFNFLD
jgi:hypothetical protein